MIDEFANLFQLTVRELRLAARRIERQSGIVLRCRLRLRKLRRRLRRCRRRLMRQREPKAETPPGQYCDWRARESRYGRLYWECRQCGRKTLHPTSAAAQGRAGERCQSTETEVNHA